MHGNSLHSMVVCRCISMLKWRSSCKKLTQSMLGAQLNGQHAINASTVGGKSEQVCIAVMELSWLMLGRAGHCTGKDIFCEVHRTVSTVLHRCAY